jgi:DNA-binding MarR family transcriptional regulator
VRTQTIGEQLIAHVPDVTRLVDRLVRDALARRASDPHDRRVVLVHITPKGLRILAKLDKPVMELHTKQLGHMSAADLKKMSELLVRARSACRSKQADAE